MCYSIVFDLNIFMLLFNKEQFIKLAFTDCSCKYTGYYSLPVLVDADGPPFTSQSEVTLAFFDNFDTFVLDMQTLMALSSLRYGAADPGSDSTPHLTVCPSATRQK